MSKTVLYVAGAAVVSAALGVVGGLYLGKRFYEAKAEERADKDIQEIRKFYEENKKNVADVEADALELTKAEARKRKKAEAKNEQLEYKLSQSEWIHTKLVDVMYKEGLDTKKILDKVDSELADNAREGYQTLSEDPDDSDSVYITKDDPSEDISVNDKESEDATDDEEPVDYSSELQEEKESLDPTKAPYVISEEDFDADDDLFEKLSYTWYNEDMTLADETNSPFTNEENYKKVVGTEFRKIISENNSIIYVRNEKRMQDYEISYRDQTYGDSLA
jgi:hypothetical protein